MACDAPAATANLPLNLLERLALRLRDHKLYEHRAERAHAPVRHEHPPQTRRLPAEKVRQRADSLGDEESQRPVQTKPIESEPSIYL